MVKITIHVEGGGESKFTQRYCSRGFGKLLEAAGFSGKMPRILAWGGRDQAFTQGFKPAYETRSLNDYPILLVDSEDPISDGVTAWHHLKNREKHWIFPKNIAEDQAQLMVTCMETWIMADRIALREFFEKLQESALLSEYNLEQYDRHRVQDALMHATRNCGKDKAYQKGERSFKALEALNPNTLKQRLPHFKRLIETLEAHLK